MASASSSRRPPAATSTPAVALIRFYGRLTVVGGFAAIVGPLLGGMLNTVTDWRGLFVFLAAIGAVILVVTLLGVPRDAAGRAPHARRVRAHRARLPDRCSPTGSSSARSSTRASSTRRCSPTSPARPSCCRTSTGSPRRGTRWRSGSTPPASWSSDTSPDAPRERWSIAGTLIVGILRRRARRGRACSSPA